MESWIFSGSGYSAACPSASIDVRVDRAGRRLPGGGAALFVLNFVIGGIIGGFVLVWRLLVAAWYVPLTIYRLIVGY